MKMKEFLETVPPYQEVEIEDLNIRIENTCSGNKPEILLFCTECDGERYFATSSYHLYNEKKELAGYKYICKNCNKTEKYIIVMGHESSQNGRAMKIGEYPIFGHQTSSKLFSLIGSDHENFLNGRRCENQGLGIGSYAYYRRVVESQKNRIIDKLQEVCEKYDNNTELIKQLELAKKEVQFSTAIELIKQNIPSSLLIDGHNPLKLLHKALSIGLHDMTDEECLKRSNVIRNVLMKLCLRINELLTDDKEFKKAVNLLANPNQELPHA